MSASFIILFNVELLLQEYYQNEFIAGVSDLSI